MLEFLLRLYHWLLNLIQRFIRRKTGTVITLDTGRRVRLGKKIAEGGYSFVFEASDADNHNKIYALKRIHCPDPELLAACRREAAVHRAVNNHPNVLPLLGMSITDNTTCYMLFPYAPVSLRDSVNRRNPLLSQGSTAVTTTTVPPWSEVTALQLFLKICRGVQALHEHGFTHRDVKIENVLLLNNDHQPVLMDMGSAGPLQESIDTRRAILNIVEQAAMHTTLPYRPPELFEGGVRVHDKPLDYTAVDVWSLGCTLHAILYGASPFECEFTTTKAGGGGCGLKIIECTHLSVLSARLPQPKPPVDQWYSPDIRTLLLEPMLRQNRFQRPKLSEIIGITQDLIVRLGGRVDESYNSNDQLYEDYSVEDGIALMSRVV